MEIEQKEQGNNTILKVSGEIDYINFVILKEAIFKLINNRVPSIVLDFIDLDFMDSSGIGLLVTSHKAVSAYGGTIGLINIREDILALLKLATVDTILKIYGSEGELA
jgi:anti-sigma B factor antagonist